MTSKRIVFMGTPEIAIPSLGAIIEAGHQIIRVYSQPPRRAGRGPSEKVIYTSLCIKE